MQADELTRRFDLGVPVRVSEDPVARGKQGLVWRLDTVDGRWAVKESFGPVTEDQVRLSTAFQEAARAAGVPTPAVRRTTEGDVFAQVGDRQVRVHEWVDVLGPDPLVDPARVGEVLAAIHRVPVPAPGPPSPWHQAPVGADRWDALVAELRAAGAPFADRLADLRDELVALESWLEPPQQLRACHRDLWADNLLPTADGDVCVLDWDESGAADPSQELGYVLFEFGRSDPGRARALTGAYRDAGGPGWVRGRGDFTMLIAQLGHITEVAASD
jgi:aminoglycoside phosphotransferase (APT) family kinase protein